MPKPSQASDTVIPHSSYKWAHLRIRAGVYYTVIHQVRKSTGIPAEKKNLARAKKVLEERLLAFLDPDDTVIRTIQEACVEFLKVKKDKISKGSLMTYHRIFKTYLTPDLLVTDTNRLRMSIMDKVDATKMAQNTKRKTLIRLRAFFEYCRDENYCDKNPISKIMVPNPVVPPVVSFTYEEIEAVIKQLRTGTQYKLHVKEREETILLIRLLSTAGLRSAEALKLKKTDILDNGIRIDGKRKSIQVPRIRFFPFSVLPEVGEICGTLKTYNPGEYVFTWRNPKNPSSALRSAQQMLGMEHEKKNLHSLRKTAINHWEKVLGIPVEIRNLLAGHTSDVKDHYYREHTIDDTIATIENLAKFRV